MTKLPQFPLGFAACCALSGQKYISPEGIVLQEVLEELVHRLFADPRVSASTLSLENPCRCECHVKGKVVLH